MLDLTSRDVSAPTRELAFGRYPLVLYAVRTGGTLERRTYCRCKAGTDRKYDDEKQVQRGDTLSSGLATPAPEVTGHPGVTESSAEQTRFCVKCREGRQRGQATENSTARPSGPADERPCLSVSVVRRRDKSAVL